MEVDGRDSCTTRNVLMPLNLTNVTKLYTKTVTVVNFMFCILTTIKKRNVNRKRIILIQFEQLQSLKSPSKFYYFSWFCSLVIPLSTGFSVFKSSLSNTFDWAIQSLKSSIHPTLLLTCHVTVREPLKFSGLLFPFLSTERSC